MKLDSEHDAALDRVGMTDIDVVDDDDEAYNAGVAKYNELVEAFNIKYYPGS
jgi:hypothetical protein